MSIEEIKKGLADRDSFEEGEYTQEAHEAAKAVLDEGGSQPEATQAAQKVMFEVRNGLRPKAACEMNAHDNIVAGLNERLRGI